MGQRLRRWRVAARKGLRRIVYSKNSSTSIAGGMALGVFIGLTPTFGFQMIPAAFFAALLRVNILAAVVAVWVTNPFTAPFIYYSEYVVGKMILPFELGSGAIEGIARLAERIAEISLVDLWRTGGAAIAAFLDLGQDVITRFVLGSIVCAAAGAAASYPLTLWAVMYVRRKRQVRTLRRADVRLARLNAAGLVHLELPPAAEGETDGGGPMPGDEGEGRPPQIVALPLKASAEACVEPGNPPREQGGKSGA